MKFLKLPSPYKAFITFVNRDYPYHYNNLKHNLLLSIIATIIVTIFATMKPNLASNIVEINYFQLVPIFAIITFITSQFFFNLGPILFKQWFEFWKVYKEIIYAFNCILTMGIFNYISILFYGKAQPDFQQFDGSEFFLVISVTLMSGLIPLSIVILINKIKHNHNFEKKHIYENSKEIEVPTKDVINPTINVENNGVKFVLEMRKIHLIKSKKNYLEVYSKNKDKIIVSKARSTTRKMEETLTESANFFRTHKSYIINFDKIISYSGNITNGLKVSIEDIEFQVPVSRSKATEFKSLVSKHTSLVYP